MVNSLEGLEGGDIFQDGDGRLFRLVGFWNTPVVILDAVEPNADGTSRRVYCPLGSTEARGLTRLVPEKVR